MQYLAVTSTNIQDFKHNKFSRWSPFTPVHKASVQLVKADIKISWWVRAILIASAYGLMQVFDFIKNRLLLWTL